MRIRKLVSLIAVISFILLIITSIVLYIVPHGRIAYWTDWKLFGLSKTEWENLHLNIGLLFILAILVHICYNWKLLITYIKKKKDNLNIITKEFKLASIITLIVCVGTYFMLPPFSSIINFGESIKNKALKRYGNPPYGHAELSSLKTFCQRTGLDLEQAIKNLKNKKIKFKGPNTTLLEIAKKNHLTPRQVYEIIKNDNKTYNQRKKLPSRPPLRLGRQTLLEFCQNFNLDIKKVLYILQKNGYKAEANSTIKQIASTKKESPFDIYKFLQQHLK